MANNKYRRFMAALMIAGMLMPPIAAYAEPVVMSDTGEELADASVIDDAAALEEAVSAYVSNELADPAQAAAYLLANRQEEVVEQTPTAERDTTLPEKFDLREKGVVTPVKLQNPFGTCWGFSAIAASEISILSALGQTYEETGLDLSEHHLTWFARTSLEDESSPQNGEGIHMLNEDEHFNGGCMFEATSMFSTGMGPVREELIPYRGLNSNTIGYGPINIFYSPDDDWTLPYDYAFVQSYTLKGSNMLPAPAVYAPDFNTLSEEHTEQDREDNYIGYDAAATDNIKRELMAGRGVSIAFCADTYMPGETSEVPLYINTEDNLWTHYTFDGGVPNHGVTIVGWDDTIPSTAFLDHTNDVDGDGLAHQPEGDGAWLVKNSWGAMTETFPNMSVWGIKDEDDKDTGYFYISYYDRGLCAPETFDYDVTDDHQGAPVCEVDQYDYLQAGSPDGWADNNGLQMANVFTAEADGNITAVSCQTNTVNVSTTYQVYLMDADDKVPTDGELAATATADYAYAGYHREKLDTPIAVKQGQRYAVVVTSCFTGGDGVYYEFSTSTGMSKEYVEEYNRQIRYRNRANPEDSYQNELFRYYTVGIVNEGESLVYINELGRWGDLAQIVPYLQEDEVYEGCTFDNFPIKAYLDMTNPDQIAAATAELPELGFAEPAQLFNMGFIAKVAAAVIAGIVVLVVVIVLVVRGVLKSRKRKLHRKELEEQVPQLQAEIARLKALAGESDTPAEAAEAVQDTVTAAEESAES